MRACAFLIRTFNFATIPIGALQEDQLAPRWARILLTWMEVCLIMAWSQMELLALDNQWWTRPRRWFRTWYRRHRSSRNRRPLFKWLLTISSLTPSGLSTPLVSIDRPCLTLDEYRKLVPSRDCDLPSMFSDVREELWRLQITRKSKLKRVN